MKPSLRCFCSYEVRQNVCHGKRFLECIDLFVWVSKGALCQDQSIAGNSLSVSSADKILRNATNYLPMTRISIEKHYTRYKTGDILRFSYCQQIA